MSAASKSYRPRPLPPGTQAAAAHPRGRRSARGRLGTPKSSPAPNPTPVPLAPEPSPALKVLSQVQVVSAVLAGALVSLALVSYGASVYVDRQLNQANRRLHQLQRQEEQLTTAQEVLKNHLAQQAELDGTALQRPQPDHVIFLRPAPSRAKSPLPPATTGRFVLPRVDTPLGY